MSASTTLLKLAEAQKSLYRLAIAMLREDKSDGIRATRWMEKHNRVLREIIDDARLHCDIDNAEAERIEQASV